jgi:hypothetical protein
VCLVAPCTFGARGGAVRFELAPVVAAVAVAVARVSPFKFLFLFLFLFLFSFGGAPKPSYRPNLPA